MATSNLPNIKELRQKEGKELELDLTALQKELFEMRFKGSSEKLPNPHRIRELKRQIARIKTLERQRAIGIAIPASDVGADHDKKVAKAAKAAHAAPAEKKPKAAKPAKAGKSAKSVKSGKNEG